MIAGKDGKKPDAPANQTRKSGLTKAELEEANTEWSEFQAEYPEVAKPMNRVVTFLANEIKALRAENAEHRQALQIVGEDRASATSDAQYNAVVEDHPDYDEIADSDDLLAWFEEQPDFIQATMRANAEDIVDGAAVSKIVGMYKAERGIETAKGNGAASGEKPSGTRKPAASPRRRIQLDSARGTPRSSPGVAAKEDDGRGQETEESVWAELRRDEEKRQAAEARA